MRFIKNLLFKLVNRCITPPIKENIDTNKQDFLLKKGFVKLIWRSLKSLIIFYLTNQNKYFLSSIEPKKHKRCLWLYYDVVQIGDALMDLAPRSLLYNLDIQIDLFTHPYIVDLFANDQFLNQLMLKIQFVLVLFDYWIYSTPVLSSRTFYQSVGLLNFQTIGLIQARAR